MPEQSHSISRARVQSLLSPTMLDHKTSPALYVSYQARTSSREIKDHGLTTGSGKSRERIGLFLTTVLLLSALFSLASRLQKTGNSSRGTEVKAAGKVDEFSPSNSANSKDFVCRSQSAVGPARFCASSWRHDARGKCRRVSGVVTQEKFSCDCIPCATDRFYLVVVGPYSDVNSTLRVKEQLEKAGS